MTKLNGLQLATLPSGIIIHVNGIPAYLGADTVVVVEGNNIELMIPPTKGPETQVITA